jgi:hypothetical protein
MSAPGPAVLALCLAVAGILFGIGADTGLGQAAIPPPPTGYGGRVGAVGNIVDDWIERSRVNVRKLSRWGCLALPVARRRALPGGR